MRISIIIPTFNEALSIEKLIVYLRSMSSNQSVCEVIVADGGSTDATLLLAQQAGAIVIKSVKKGRAAQMNAGAAIASGEICYFLHADSYPPANFDIHILQAVNAGFFSGCYRLAFDYHHWFLKFNAWFTRFNIDAIRFGDQSLFVTKAIFNKIQGFDETLIIMEDQEIIYRIKKQTRFIVLPGKVITSARKYLENGIYKLQAVFFLICFLYKLGVSQQKLISLYRKLISQQKV